MNKQSIIKALQEARANAKKRKFSQTVELIVNFKLLNLKNPEHQQDFFLQLKHPWKKVKICGLVDGELIDQSKKHFDKTITKEEFVKYKDKKEVKKLAREYDFFVAQAGVMPQVAQTFGRYFGPINKMPNPKAGQVVPPNANLEIIKKKLQTTIRVLIKSVPLYQIGIGKEEGKDEEIAEDILNIHDQLARHLPAEQQNIRSMYVKLTMGKPVKVE